MDEVKQSQYQLDLLSMPMGVKQYHFCLDYAFFALVESDEITKGNISADIEVKKSIANVEISIVMEGEVEGTCDRCLAPLMLDVDVDETIYVKLGERYCDEGDDTITISEEDGVYDIAWLLYEYIVLSLPAVKIHEDGECDEEMVERIEALQPGHQETVKDEENDEVDPRWAALKNILNN